MKRPYIISKWMQVHKEPNQWKDWLGKQSYDYYIKIPEWLARPFMQGNIKMAFVQLFANVPCGRDRQQMENTETFDKYWKENWNNKVSKARKINQNYILFEK